jgi:regulatory protein
MRREARKSLDPDKAADPRAAHAAAVALLARRDYSTQDIERKLKQRGFGSAAVTQAITELAQSRLLNDERFSENLVTYRARRGQGPARIRQELQRSGLDQAAIDNAIKGPAEDGRDRPDFVKLAREARARKFGPEMPKDWKERARQARFLQYRGFSTDHIRAVLEGVEDDAESIGDPDPN